MGRIFITGDTHGMFMKLNSENFPIQKELTKNDYVIICGDFGGVWNDNFYWVDWLENKPWTTLFVDGNHENFDMLNEFDIDKWNGGNVHFVRPSVIHLMRGQVFTICDKTFFTFGGARSHDISGGVLNKNDPSYCIQRKILQKSFTPFRIEHLDWWKEEMPSEVEMEEGLVNLERVDWRVNYILTHDCPASTLNLMGRYLYKADELNYFLEKVRAQTIFDRWYFGHYHIDRMVADRQICLYDTIEELYERSNFKWGL